jgi:hypothetical protein
MNFGCPSLRRVLIRAGDIRAVTNVLRNPGCNERKLIAAIAVVLA